MGWRLSILLLAACVMAEAARYIDRPWRAVGLLAESRAGVQPDKAAPPPRLELQSTALIPMPQGVPSAHASALTALPNDELLALWWAGTQESAADVAIYSARWRNGQWSAAHRVVEREELSRQLGFGVRRLGNPSLWLAGDGRVHLYAVATGLGGWAASRVVQLVSGDGGESFAPTRVLALSPLFNTSVLVRAQPVALADGGWLLPAYFELGRKYPLVVAFDAQGTPQWTRRIGTSATSLQPTLLPISSAEVRALMRDHGPQGRIQQAISNDSGVSWQDQPAAALVNKDNSIAALRLADGGYVLVHNDQAPAPATARQWLRVSTSSDAQQWSASQDVALGAPGEEFSYPSVQQVGRQLHITYTSQRRAIAHSVYNILPP